MKITVDAHVHSILTNHAYSTIEENTIHAKEKGISAIAVTDHMGIYEKNNLENIIANLTNRSILPKRMHDVGIIKGVELDIVDKYGKLAHDNVPYYYDTSKTILEAAMECSDIVIASVHKLECDYTAVQNTELYINALQNPNINIIGHCGRLGLDFDEKEVVKVARCEHKAIEINASSLNKSISWERCRKIAISCAEELVPITIGSDAHCSYSIGIFDKVYELLESVCFPEDLILCSSEECFKEYFKLERKMLH